MDPEQRGPLDLPAHAQLAQPLAVGGLAVFLAYIAFSVVVAAVLLVRRDT